ncbi:MAG: hypothetical protein ACKO5C_09235 [Ferruginibacter sp.]
MHNRYYFLIVFLLMTFGATAQQTDRLTRMNEIRLNIPMTIAGLPEINYERLMDDNLGLGVSVAIAVDNPDRMPYRTQLMTFGRLYFGKKKGTGFYIEANMAGVQQKDRYTDWIGVDSLGIPTYKTIEEKSFNLGFGAAIGVKLLAKNGYVGDLYAGGGRLFGTSVTNGYLRIGLAIGRRF